MRLARTAAEAARRVIPRRSSSRGASASSKDIPPFFVMQEINIVRGLNLVGMKRAGIPPAERVAIRKVHWSAEK